MTFVSLLDTLTVGATALGGLFVLSATSHASGWFRWPFRATIGSTIFAMALKTVERMQGDEAGMVDLWRDASVLALFCTVIAFHRHRFHRL